jgi:hypothetical protein
MMMLLQDEALTKLEVQAEESLFLGTAAVKAQPSSSIAPACKLTSRKHFCAAFSVKFLA